METFINHVSNLQTIINQSTEPGMFKLFNRENKLGSQPSNKQKTSKALNNITRAIDGTISSFSEYIVDRVQTASYDADLRSVKNEVVYSERMLKVNSPTRQPQVQDDFKQLRQTLLDHRYYKQTQFSTDTKSSPVSKPSNYQERYTKPAPKRTKLNNHKEELDE